jgi:hypothetical protein
LEKKEMESFSSKNSKSDFWSGASRPTGVVYLEDILKGW